MQREAADARTDLGQPRQHVLVDEGHRVDHAQAVLAGRLEQHLEALSARARVDDDRQFAIARRGPQRGDDLVTHDGVALVEALRLPGRAAAQARQVGRGREPDAGPLAQRGE